ncbi:MAG TPA: L-ribulose-5-phosphate 4-epimerase [Phycisphaerales bacterium]|nr:L-ribulose-5-phosphate 4-epimerase [Phycisphaerales bacterium]HCD31664.1 L-ribulose-5-phosphate 4-epimerase [Phycisphaerales bacterium]|tara:strand:- start:807 stop:1496 length:690 start_codon:yes stop_codon:yes gene_type:complete
MLEQLKEEVCKANLDLVKHGLVTLTWGNVSGFDNESQLMVIKPSGVSYDIMKPSHMVVVDLDGRVIEGDMNPSSDTDTHILLYQNFKGIGGITHTHSFHATMFAQARQPIPCYGTTHADHFMGPVPVTRPLTAQEVEQAYEHNTGKVILDCFETRNPIEIPGVLVAGHAPFAWGKSATDSVKNAVALEAVARMAMGTQQINPNAPELEDYVLDKHYQRKHGPNATYGQK